MLIGFVKLVDGLCFTDCKEPFKGFLGLVMFEFEFLAGSDFLIFLVSESVLIWLLEVREDVSH